MAVFRVVKNDDYSVMSNIHFKECNMSLKAKGLLSLMLSLPDEWDYSLAGLVSMSKDGKDSVMKALVELEEFGYLKRTQMHNKLGRFSGYDYDIYERPFSEKPNTEKPYAEKPYAENPPQLNTNISNTKKINKEKEKIYKKEKDAAEEFAELWEIYPRKVGKAKAFRMYRKAREKGVAYETIRKGIEAYAAEVKARGTAIQYVKHGATWFYNECWDDEYPDKPINEYANLPGVTVL